MGYDPKIYPNLAKLDDRVRELLKSPPAEHWSPGRADYEICKIHPFYWMERHGWIKSSDVGESGAVEIIPFKLNPVQEQIANHVAAHLLGDGPKEWTRIMLHVLKHRKAGISTFFAGLDYWFARFIENWNQFVIADISTHTDNIIEMIALFHERDECGVDLGGEFAPPRRIPLPGEKKGLRFSNGSMIEKDSGHTSNPGTSGTLQGAHCSENAKWRDPENAENSLFNSVTRKGFCCMVRESTAKGQNKFAADTESAAIGESQWEFVFIAWPDMPDCCDEVAPNETITYTEQERLLADVYKLNEGHIKFRRRQISTLGSESLFKQDFPLNRHECFLAHSNSFFDLEDVSQRQEEVKLYRAARSLGGYGHVGHDFDELMFNLKEKAKKRDLDFEKFMDLRNVMPRQAALRWNDHKVTYEWIEERVPEMLMVFREPIAGRTYVVSVDPSEGKQMQDSKADNSVVEVFDAWTCEQVAEWAGDFDEEVTALYSIMIATMYNEAILVPEINNRTGAMLETEIKRIGYSRVFHRQTIAKNRIDREFGWRTTHVNKPHSCGLFRKKFKNENCTIHSLELLREMGYFIQDGNKLCASGKEHDDRVTCTSIAIAVIDQTPMYKEKPRRLNRRLPQMGEGRGAGVMRRLTRRSRLEEQKRKILERYM